MIPSLRLMRRIWETQTAYILACLGLLQRLPGNPLGIVRCQLDEALMASMARHRPQSSYNCVLGLRPGLDHHIAPLRDWFAAAGVEGQFEIIPGYDDPALVRELARLGYYQSSFQVSLASLPPLRMAAAEAVNIERVESASKLEALLDRCGDAAGTTLAYPCKSMLRAGFYEAGWSLYFGAVEGGAMAAAILFIKDKVGYCPHLAFDVVDPGRALLCRALLARCIADARDAGVDFVCSTAELLSQRHDDLVRMGMQVKFVRSLWTPLHPRPRPPAVVD
jgi:hypothetical protein